MICRYQMQLTELLKNTQSEHPDYNDLKEATEEMRRAAFEINEGRRSFEARQQQQQNSSNQQKQDTRSYNHGSNTSNQQKLQQKQKKKEEMPPVKQKRPPPLSLASSTASSDIASTSDCPSPTTYKPPQSAKETVLKRIPSKRCSKKLLRFFNHPSI